MSRITHAVWDWNGTLFDDIDLCIETINGILEEQNLDKINKDEYRKKILFSYYSIL